MNIHQFMEVTGWLTWISAAITIVCLSFADRNESSDMAYGEAVIPGPIVDQRSAGERHKDQGQ